MDHYENILDNQSYSGEKYKPDESFKEFMNSDEFFAAVFKNVPVNKKPVPKQGAETEKPQSEQEEGTEKEEAPAPPPPPPVETEPAPDNTSERDRVITKYIKKCYRVIVLKCHPDKNKLDEDINNNNKKFLKCQEYYDNNFLIGLLYIFYLYKLKPPAPLNIATPIVPEDDCSIIIDRIIREIRVIQDKLELFSMPIEVEPEPEVEP